MFTIQSDLEINETFWLFKKDHFLFEQNHSRNTIFNRQTSLLYKSDYCMKNDCFTSNFLLFYQQLFACSKRVLATVKNSALYAVFTIIFSQQFHNI
jgi:hypothetical protein